MNGKPAEYDDPIILVGAHESYEARCRDCYMINRSPDHAQVTLEKPGRVEGAKVDVPTELLMKEKGKQVQV